ncbi:28783_t:CDS:1, partial [Racocetra persica]
ESRIKESETHLSNILIEREELVTKKEELEIKLDQSQQEITNLKRQNGTTNKLIAKFQQETEKVMKDLKQKLDAKDQQLKSKDKTDGNSEL